MLFLLNHRVVAMVSPKSFMFAAVLAFAAASVAELRAGGDLVMFPGNYAAGTMYMAFDHAASKTYRELYANDDALAGLRSAGTLPSGTVLTSVAYKVKLDDKGEPLRDAHGRFIKTDEIAGYSVMEKRAGWGTGYADDTRNGEWEYQVFTPAKSVNTSANLKSCFACHKPQAAQDYLFTLDKIKAAAVK